MSGQNGTYDPQATVTKALIEAPPGEICAEASIYSFSDQAKRIPSRRSFALRDAIDGSQRHNGTYPGKAVAAVPETYDRLIVITDEQAHDTVPGPRGKGYVINVASYKNGVGYGKWTHVDGWSEAVVYCLTELERIELSYNPGGRDPARGLLAATIAMPTGTPSMHC